MRHERRSGSDKEEEMAVSLNVNTPASTNVGRLETLLVGGASQTLVSISFYGPRSSDSPVLGWKEEARIRMAVCKFYKFTAMNDKGANISTVLLWICIYSIQK